MSLEQAILGLTAELKRYNDRNGLVLGGEAVTEQPAPAKAAAKPAAEKPAATKPAAEKPAAEKPAAAKPAAAKAPAKLSVADVQTAAGKYIAVHGRDEFKKILAGLGYANISGAEEADGEAGLKAIFDAVSAEDDSLS